MRILGIILFEFLLGYILQAFSIVLGLYAFNKRKIDVKKFVITGSVMSVVLYVTRLLPVTFGVHTVLDYVMVFLFAALYLKLPVIQSVAVVIAEIAIILILDFSCTYLLIGFFGNEEFLRNLATDLIIVSSAWGLRYYSH